MMVSLIEFGTALQTRSGKELTPIVRLIIQFFDVSANTFPRQNSERLRLDSSKLFALLRCGWGLG